MDRLSRTDGQIGNDLWIDWEGLMDKLATIYG